MDSCQRELRRSAAQAFKRSLDDLETTFSAPPQPNPSTQTSADSVQVPPEATADLDLSSFEQAVADIEEFLQRRG